MPDDACSYRRVMVIGSPGAGKTEFGALLAERLGLPCVDLDDEHWGPGWAKPPDDVWRARVQELSAPPVWLLAGNFGGTIELRARAADLVINMSLPPWLCVWRLLLRSVKILLGRQVWRLPRACRQGPDWEPLRDYPEFLLFTLRFRRRSLPRAMARLRAAGVERIVDLRSGAQVRRLTAEIQTGDDPSAVLASWLTPLSG